MAEYVIQATADPNVASPTVTVNLDEPPGFVMDSQVTGQSAPLGEPTPSELTATFFVRDENLPTEEGLYDVELLVTPIAPYLNVTVLLRRNGLTLFPATFGTADPPGWFRLTGPYDTSNRGGGGPFTVPVIAGDEYEVVVLNNAGLQVHAIRFTLVPSDGFVGEPLPLLGAPEPVGGIGPTDWHGAYLNTDPTYRAVAGDMVVLADGTILVAFYEEKDLGPDPGGSGDHIFGRSLILKRFDGSWHVVTYDLWGHGYQSTLVAGGAPVIAMVTDGSDAWIAFGQTDGTSVPQGANWNWRVIRYHAGVLSELGSSGGRRAIVSRTLAPSNAGYETSALDIKLDPAGRPWVSWHETLDLDPGLNPPQLRPHVWRFDGSSWQDTGLVQPPQIHGSGGWTSGYAQVSAAARRVALGFLASGEAVALYGAHHYPPDVDGSLLQDDFVVQRFGGSGWTDVVQFSAGDLWPQLRAVNFPPVGVYRGNWYQGADLVAVGDELWALLALAYAGDRLDSGVVASYTDAGLTPLAQGTVYDHAGGGTFREGGWNAPTPGDMALDSEGFAFVVMSTDAAAGTLGEPASWYGDLLLLKAESGLSDGWTAASRHALPFYQAVASMPTALAFHGTTCYTALAVYDTMLGDAGNVRERMLVVRRARDGTYVPWSQEAEPLARGIVFSFTPGAHDVPVWTRVDDPDGM